MKFYDFNEIKSRANCIEITKHLGCRNNSLTTQTQSVTISPA